MILHTEKLTHPQSSAFSHAFLLYSTVLGRSSYGSIFINIALITAAAMLFLSRVIVSAVFLYPMLNPKDKDVSMSCELPTKTDIKNLNLAQFRELLTRFGNCTTIAQHRYWSRHGGYVTLINATPYDWNLTSIYQDQMEYDFPGHIPAGMLTRFTQRQLPADLTAL